MFEPPQRPLRTLDDIRAFERAAPLEERLPARSVHGLFAGWAASSPDRPALTMIMTGDEDEAARTLSYGELGAGITRAANLFAELGGKGAGVALLLPSLLETQLALWGAETSGYAVPINFLLAPEHIAGLVRAAGAKILVTLGPHPQLDVWQKALRVRELVQGLTLVCVAPTASVPEDQAVSFATGLGRQPADRLTFGEARGGDDVAAYFHTGGTTGAPKLVAQTHLNQLSASYGGALLINVDHRDAILNGLPMFHVGGTLACGLTYFIAGARVLLLSPSGFRNPAMIRRYYRLIERHRVTLIGGVPTAIAALCEVPVDGDLSSVRVAYVGAASTPRAVVERFEAHTGKPLHELFGMTEVSGIASLDCAAAKRTIGSVGCPLPYTEARIRRLGEGGKLGDECAPNEVGVLTLRGPTVSPGYRDPAQNAAMFADGWLDTGDLVYKDEEGKLYIAGRSKDLIIRGGHNIDPAMIEEAFTAHPAVALAAAVGEPDVYAGELPVCYVTLRPGATVTVDELRDFALPRIGERPAWPKQIHVMAELPLTVVGKIYKPALRADAARRVAEAAATDALGRVPASVAASPGGKHGMIVKVTLAAEGASKREAVEAALAGYLFEASVVVEGG